MLDVLANFLWLAVLAGCLSAVAAAAIVFFATRKLD